MKRGNVVGSKAGSDVSGTPPCVNPHTTMEMRPAVTAMSPTMDLCVYARARVWRDGARSGGNAEHTHVNARKRNDRRSERATITGAICAHGRCTTTQADATARAAHNANRC